jgi:hypothetical protein
MIQVIDESLAAQMDIPPHKMHLPRAVAEMYAEFLAERVNLASVDPRPGKRSIWPGVSGVSASPGRRHVETRRRQWCGGGWPVLVIGRWITGAVALDQLE